MNIDYSFFKVSDGQSLAYKKWINVDNPKGAVIIIHGMAEHIERYDNFSQYLNSKGYVVYGIDQRGHGKTSGRRGFFGHKKAWKKVLNDQIEFYSFVQKTHSNLEISLFAHSMGSYLLREILSFSDITPSKVILSGTGYASNGVAGVAKALAGIVCLFRGAATEANLLDKMVNEPFSKAIENPVTKFDWLSRDPNQVAKYINDNECGFVCTNKFFHDFFTIMKLSSSINRIKKINKELPILLYSGDQDPAGGVNASGVKKVYTIYKKLGLNVSISLNKDGRHENINEINKDEVYNSVHNFLNCMN